MFGIQAQVWAPALTAAVAVLALCIREIQHRGETIEKRVDRAVNAAIGGQLVELSRLATESRASIQLAEEGAEKANGALGVMLQKMTGQEERLTDLLAKAEELVPRIDSALSFTLVAQVLDSQRSPEQRIAAGMAVADHPDASIRELDLAATAVGRMGATALELRLTERILAARPNDPEHLAAVAHLKAELGQIPPDEALRVARDLMVNNPTDRNTLSAGFNLFMELGAYGDMLELCENMVAHGTPSALVLRSMGVALAELDSPLDDVKAAYNQALDSADDPEERTNTGRPYIAYLLDKGDFEEASRIVSECVTATPDSPELLVLAGRLLRSTDRWIGAQLLFELADQLGNDSVKIAVQREKRRAVARGLIEEAMTADTRPRPAVPT